MSTPKVAKAKVAQSSTKATQRHSSQTSRSARRKGGISVATASNSRASFGTGVGASTTKCQSGFKNLKSGPALLAFLRTVLFYVNNKN